MRELVNRVISLSDGTVAEGSTLFGGRNMLYPILQVLNTIMEQHQIEQTLSEQGRIGCDFEYDNHRNHSTMGCS